MHGRRNWKSKEEGAAGKGGGGHKFVPFMERKAGKSTNTRWYSMNLLNLFLNSPLALRGISVSISRVIFGAAQLYVAISLSGFSDRIGCKNSALPLHSPPQMLFTHFEICSGERRRGAEGVPSRRENKFRGPHVSLSLKKIQICRAFEKEYNCIAK